MEDDTEERLPKRQKRDSSYKSKAFEKFKKVRNGEKNKYQVDEIENVYDVVPENEYNKKVLDRQDDDWIVDDDGSGYVEDGRDIFDDDLDKESIAAASTSLGKGMKRKNKAVSEKAGKGNVKYLLSNMPAKKKEEEKLDDDQALSEILGEIDDAPVNVVHKPKPSVSSQFSPLSVKRAEKEYLNSLASFKKPVSPLIQKSPRPKKPLQPSQNSVSLKEDLEAVFKDIQNMPDEQTEESASSSQDDQLRDIGVVADEVNGISESHESTQILEPETDCFNDDLDLSQIEEAEAKFDNKAKCDVESRCDEEKSKLWTMEEEFMQDWTPNAESPSSEELMDAQNSEIPLTDVGDKKVFRFFWWDAFEDVKAQPGVVCLFGKTYNEKTKSYISCSVVVRNIERRIFFLPRPTEQNSEKPVTPQDVYTEVNESIMKNMKVKQFKARPVTKKYAFDPQIPTESEYIEVRYSAKDPRLSSTTEGKTFSRVFGTESSFLELLLLDRKIKGPCWLDINSPAPAVNPVTWCKLEVNCNKPSDISIVANMQNKPPLVVTSINMRSAINPKTRANEIVMISCVTNVSYCIDKQTPKVPFQKHFCVFTSPPGQMLPINIYQAVNNYKATTLQKMDSEKALLNYFISQFEKLDSDVIVGHDLQGYQMSLLAQRLITYHSAKFSRLGRLRRTNLPKFNIERNLFVGRLVCDIKISAKELIKSRSYDLDALCVSILKVKDGQRIDFEAEDIPKMYQTPSDILRLVSLTMQDTAFILKIMYSLNILPLALQITNIAGNVMSRTLMGGRSERNEFLLLHAFSEKNFIVPDKIFGKKDGGAKSTASRKKPTYSGGLVLDPKVGFYDKLILLMDFNSLYPSIIQEYNLCFTTMPPDLSDDNMVLPDRDLPLGVLPTEIRKLVESRRSVKDLMKNADISTDLRMQYHIRQMALKLTANSMYGCLGFSNSRFYAKNLAALVTYKGREILTNTKNLVEKMNYEVIYGDTDSLMINTNIVDYDQVFHIGSKIKQEINKLYKQVELDIDGVFKYLLLLKKKKYAAVTLSKDKNGALKAETEYKGLDIVRRDWSKIASEAGKFVLNQILSDQSADDRVNNILGYLRKIREDLEGAKVPLSMLVITKQLTRNPSQYSDPQNQPHVQVALRYNKQSGGHFRSGDTVSYLICEDGTDNSATRRAYHVEEFKNSKTFKIDVKYYLSQQIHPVVNRICGPIEELDKCQLADCLGLDYVMPTESKTEIFEGTNITEPEFKYRNAEKFVFKCLSCKCDNSVEEPLVDDVPVLAKCSNSKCQARPADYVRYIQNQMIRTISRYIEKYYRYEMYCEDPLCDNETTRMPISFAKTFPICPSCNNAVLLKKYTEQDLFSQLSYFQYMFDLSKVSKKPSLGYQLEKAYQDIKETVDKRLHYSAYASVNLDQLFSQLLSNKEEKEEPKEAWKFEFTDDEFEDEE